MFLILTLFAILPLGSQGTASNNIPQVNSSAKSIETRPDSYLNTRPGPQKSVATIFRKPIVEGGSHALPLPITIIVTGKNSEMILRQLLEQLGEKPAIGKP